MDPGGEPIRPVFVGGTGRSGTTIAGRLIDSFPEIRITQPPEVRFIAGTNGVLDVVETATRGQTLDGRVVAPQRLVDNLLGPWFKRRRPSGLVGGVHLSIDKPSLRDATHRYLDEFPDDPYGASRRLTEAVISARITTDQPRRWVDTTPKNARRSDLLLEVFPDARVVHMTRDGRDVAMSFADQAFGPADPLSALQAWFERMLLALNAEYHAPAGSVLRLPLPQLVRTDRQASLHGLADFAGLTVTPEVQGWFDREVDAERMHEGRWRAAGDAELVATLDREYALLLEQLQGPWGNPLGGGSANADEVSG
jgi:hypothetical protein